MQFDLAVLGDSGEAWAAVEAAFGRGLRVAALRPVAGGRVAAVVAAYGDGRRLALPASPAELVLRAVARREAEIDRLRRDGVAVFRGGVRLTGPHSAESLAGGVAEHVTADRLVIAVGTTARRPRGVPFDGRTVLLPEDVAELRTAPRSIAVLGQGPTATAFSRLLTTAGSNVERFADAAVMAVRRCGDGVVVLFDDELSGRPADRRFDAVLFAGPRLGATAALHLAACGLEADDEGRLWCDPVGRTWTPHVAAVGEVVGFPSALRDDADAADRAVAALCGEAVEVPTACLAGV